MRAPLIAVALAICLAIGEVTLASSQGFSSDPQEAKPSPTNTSGQQPPPPRPLNPTQEVASETPAGPAIAIGPAELRFGGYLGVTVFTRSTNGGGGVGTDFGAIPYGDELRGNVSETRLSAQSSRITLRVDANFDKPRPRFRKLAGYFEMDFNGAVPNTIAVSSTSAGFRLRHAYAEVQYGETMWLGVGQAFSLMTPQKGQISLWPSDVEMSQAIDTNYLAGMVWGRIPQVRFTWRPSRTLNWAFSAENPEQQLGGGLVTLPSCCASELAVQYNTGNNGLGVPNLMPDLVTRLAVNPTPAVHVDVGGIVRVFRHTIAPYDQRFTATGGGGNVNGRVNLTPAAKVIGQLAMGSGIGRYIGGLAPDLTFDAGTNIQPLPVTSWVTGVEYSASPTVSVAGYYSGVSLDNRAATDRDGTFIGFGFPGAADTNNKSITELTFTGSLLAFKSEDRGSAQINLQASWLERKPWHQGTGPASASMFMFFAQVRYNLP